MARMRLDIIIGSGDSTRRVKKMLFLLCCLLHVCFSQNATEGATSVITNDTDILPTPAVSRTTSDNTADILQSRSDVGDSIKVTPTPSHSGGIETSSSPAAAETAVSAPPESSLSTSTAAGQPESVSSHLISSTTTTGAAATPSVSPSMHDTSITPSPTRSVLATSSPVINGTAGLSPEPGDHGPPGDNDNTTVTAPPSSPSSSSAAVTPVLESSLGSVTVSPSQSTVATSPVSVSVTELVSSSAHSSVTASINSSIAYDEIQTSSIISEGNTSLPTSIAITPSGVLADVTTAVPGNGSSEEANSTTEAPSLHNVTEAVSTDVEANSTSAANSTSSANSTEATSTGNSTENDSSTVESTTKPFDPCSPDPCENEGNCTSDGGNYTCSCQKGWLGINCTQEDFCLVNPCENNGTCTIESGEDYSCDCVVDWKGKNCSDVVTPCESTPCLNGGVCNRLNATEYNCTCLAGYNGTTCDFELDPCESSPCINDGTCEKGNGTHFTCNCTSGFIGDTCETELDPCDLAPCQNGGNCTKENGTHYECACVLGFTGDHCETNIDDCAPEPCQNGAACTDGINNYTCTCTRGWEGTNCTEDIDECQLNTDGCHKYANCTNTEGSYLCTCDTGYEGDGYLCTFMSPCERNPCVNSGECFSRSHIDYDCICKGGWGGKNCSEDINECVNGTNNCDEDWGVCNNTLGSYTCQCREGSMGDGETCTESKLYPYNRDAAVFNADDAHKHYYVTGGIPVSGAIYHDLHLYSNGYMTLGSAYVSPNPPQDSRFPPGIPVFAPYWTDIDTSLETSGSVFVDVYDLISEKPSGHEEVTAKIKSDAATYGNITDFNATFIMVVTWEHTAPYPANKTAGKESATFQAALASDSQRGFVMYNYEWMTMMWSRESLGRRIMFGYSDGVDQTSALPAQSGMPVPWKSSNIDVSGRWFYDMGEVENDNLPCLQWYVDDMNRTGSEVTPETPYSCPCTEQHAERDTRLYMDSHVRNMTCYKYRFTMDNQPQPLCCYDEQKALVLGEEGSFLMMPGDADEAGYRSCCEDSHLCHLFYKRRGIYSCAAYKPPAAGFVYGDPHISTLDGRPYTFNALGEYWLMKQDDAEFSLQGRTEPAGNLAALSTYHATALTAVVAKANGTDTVEIRRYRADTFSAYEDLVVLINGTIVVKQSELNPGERMAYTGIEIQKVDLPKSNADLILPSSSMDVQFDAGVGLKTMLCQGILSVQVLVDQKYKNRESTSGLLGSFDDDDSNDMTKPDGSVLEVGASEEEIYNFLSSWAITKNDSIFTYGEETFDTYNNISFTPTFIGDMLGNISGNFPDVNETVLESICGASPAENARECTIDFIATGNANLAHATKKMSDNFNKDKENVFGKSSFLLLDRMQSLLQVTGNSTVDIQLYASFYSSADTSVTRTLDIPMYSGSPLTQKIYVTDESTGFLYLYWPRVVYSNCGPNGEARTAFLNQMEFVYSYEKFYLAKCECSTGFGGETCMDTKDECDPNRCFANCTASTTDTNGYTCAACPEGMIGNGLKCYEENECLLQEPCQHQCVNTPGGYQCHCDSGYSLNDDAITCSDVDECIAGTHNCTGMGQYCHNTQGSFECKCKAGFFMQNDTCKDAPRRFGGKLKFKVIHKPNSNSYIRWDTKMLDTRSESFHQAAAIIEDTIDKPYQDKYKSYFIGSKVTKLSNGSIVTDFDLIFGDGPQINDSSLDETLMAYLSGAGCKDSGPDCSVGALLAVDVTASGAGVKDLCVSPTDNDCEMTSTDCTSSGGKFKCTCKMGYRPLFDYTTICQDIDECAEGLSSCDADQSVCENSPGSFKCNCLPGYIQQVNNTCKDICEDNPCQNGGTCSKTDSGYSCKCQGIWTGPNCGEENAEAKRYRLIAIIVGAVVGTVCLILLILLIYACCRSQQRKNGGYYTGSDAAFDSWETSTLQQEGRVIKNSDYEMAENGSKQNLLVAGGNGRPMSGENNAGMAMDENSPPGNETGSVDYSSVNPDGRGSPRPQGPAQGVQNPAYSDNLNNSNNAFADRL